MNDIPEVASDAPNFQELWQSYAVWDETQIKGFFGTGKYYFLSNFYPCEIHFDGLVFPSTENAYQAAKVPFHLRQPFLTCSARESKIKGNDKTYHKLDKEWWDAVKRDIMFTVVFDKFYRHDHLAKKLLLTGSRYLEETNHWHDTFWGVNYQTGNGKNTLGQVLMEVREFLHDRVYGKKQMVSIEEIDITHKIH